MYTRYFGLSENPFALSPDPRYLYLSRRHQEALAHLRYGITQGGGFVQLTGEVGTGKTLMIRTLLEQLPDHVDVALILYPFLSVREFVAAICHDLRVPCTEDASLKAVIDALNAYLLANHAKGRRTVLIIDEAQKLSREVLEQVRLLTNLETTKEKLLQILLIGQPELSSLLAQQDLRQLAQRVTARYNLTPLSVRETREYIDHRVRVAGGERSLFTRGAMLSIHRSAGGTPRLINVLCDRALLGAYALGRSTVSVSMVRKAAAEIGRVTEARSGWRPPLAAVSGVLSMAALAAAAWMFAPAALLEHALPQPAPAVTAAPPAPSLTALLNDAALRSDTDAAFTWLFRRWQLDATNLTGDTACERAAQAGLRCALVTGNWNNLRQYNRPAVIELLGQDGQRHHVVVSALTDTHATLEFDGRPYALPIVEIDRFWLGKSLLLWKPPVAEPALHLGMRGPAVAWLRRALAQADGVEVGAGEMIVSDVFDSGLEAQVKAFQRAHQLPVDGVAGQLTLLRLTREGPLLIADNAKGT